MVRTKVMTVMRWYAQDEVNQEESEHNEVDGIKKWADCTGKATQVINLRTALCFFAAW